MALFGIQLVLTMVMASILSKILPHYSLARWLLCKTGLTYYLHPTDEELKAAAGITSIAKKATKSSSSNNKSHKNSTKGKSQNKIPEVEEFSIPRNISVTLKKSEVTSVEVIGLRFYSDYQWLLDFALCSAIVYTLSEIYLFVSPPKAEINLSMLWCFLVVGFALKIMFSLTLMYFSGESSGGEKEMVILSFCIYLLIALGVLIISEEKLDLGLDKAYESFNRSSVVFLQAQGLNPQAPTSKMAFKLVLALMAAVIGAFYTFPGMRLGRMHWDSLMNCGDRKIRRMMLHVNFISPIFLVLLWVRPISRRYFTETIFAGYSEPLMSSAMFETLRVALVAIVGLTRLATMPLYLQSYLDMARENIEALGKETGKISNKQFQLKIARVFYYLCVVTLQYIAPVVLCIFLSLMCKTLGGMEWGNLWSGDSSDSSSECGLNPDASNPLCGGGETESGSALPLTSLHEAETVAQASHVISLGLDELKKIFTAEFYRGVLGFSTWWCVFAWFSSATFGLLYQSYFVKG